MKILLIGDDYTLSQNITEALHAEDLHTEVVYDGLLVENMLRKDSIACVINLPGKNGFDLCKAYCLRILCRDWF